MAAMQSYALQPGDLIDDTYRIVKRVGEGGMGEVYEATHTRLAGRYAIKVLLREIAQDPGLLARFAREAQVTSSLRHPNIVNVLDFRQTAAGTHYIVMEFLEGVDLAAELQRTGELPLPRVADFVDQITSGLAAAHEQGIVHRDLKPPNLFLVVLPGSRRELVKIVDFGISKVRRATSQLTRTATVMGTPQYMSPEQALGQIDRIDARSDQFSLAAIVYEMISGHCAFVGDSLPTLMYQLVHVDPPPLTARGLALAPAVEAVVRRGLSKQPEARFPSVLDFAQAFAAAVAGRPASAAVGPAPAAAGATAASGAPGAMRADVAVAQPGWTRQLPPRESRFGAARPAPSADTTFRSTASESVVRPPARVGRARAAAIGTGVLVAAGLAAAAIWLGDRSASEPEAPEPAAAAAAAAAAATPAGSSSPAPEAATGATAPAEVTVEVQDPRPGLLVSIDESAPRSLPITLRRDSGQHVLVFEAPGYRSRTMKLDSSRDVSLVLSLAKVPGASRVKETRRSKPIAAPAAPETSPAATGPASTPPPAARSRPRSSAFTDL
jgi:eukaryotic-like serine/threonine-protein kinase